MNQGREQKTERGTPWMIQLNSGEMIQSKRANINIGLQNIILTKIRLMKTGKMGKRRNTLDEVSGSS